MGRAGTEALGLLSAAAEQLWGAVQRYRGNEMNVMQLGKLVKNTVSIAEAAAMRDSHAAAPVIASLMQHVQQAKQLVDSMCSMSTFQKILKMAPLQEALGAVTTGIRDCLAAFSAANFCLSQQHQRALGMMQSSLDAWWERQARDNQDLLQAMAAQHERSNAMLLDVVQTMMERMEMTPRRLAVEVQEAASSSTEGSDQERQVRWGPAMVTLCDDPARTHA